MIREPHAYLCECSGHCWAYLTKWGVVIVDVRDRSVLERSIWCIVVKKYVAYACRSNKQGGVQKTVRMHVAIVKPSAGHIVDHKNHNGLDNRRHNLRCTDKSGNQQNQRNRVGRTSSYKGVFKYSKNASFYAAIGFRGKSIYLGAQNSEIEAARVYDEAAYRLFGAMAYLNFSRD